MNKLPLKTLNLKFDAKRHMHFLNDVHVPGCTTISGTIPKPWLAPWACSEMYDYILKQMNKCEELPGLIYSRKNLIIWLMEGKKAYLNKRDKAADFGTQAHDWCSRHIIDGVIPTVKEPIEVLNAVNQFLRWKEEVNPEFMLSEHQVASEIHQFACIIDTVIQDLEGLWILEIKTSNDVFTYPKFPDTAFKKLKTEMALQTAAQVICLLEMDCPPLVGRRILWIPKTGEPYLDYKIQSSQDADAKCYLAALELYNCLKEVK